MTFYQEEIEKISRNVYSKQWQIDIVVGTRKYIDNHYGSALDLSTLSHLRLTSKYHLLRLFRRYYGQTPKQYVTDKRIKKSKEHLQSGMSISDCCFAVGFESPSSFCTLFKSKTGLTPTDFQKKQLSQSPIDSGPGFLQK